MKGWIIYDGRAEGGDTDAAMVLEACIGNGIGDLRQAIDTWEGHDAVVAEYDANNCELTNERIIGHMREGKEALLERIKRS